MAQKFIQPQIEISNRYVLAGRGCKARPARKADNLTAICELKV
jgi:hypothetical protein